MLKYFFIFFLFFNFIVSAEIVQKIDIKGNERISSETIKVYGEIILNNDYSNLDLNNVLKNLYETNFFEDVKISLSDGILKIIVNEYPIIYSIDIEGENSKSVKTKLLKKLQLKENESFVESKLIDDVNLLKKLYSSVGFNFANIEAKIKKFDGNRITLIYYLSKGKKTDIANINFLGDKKIKSKRLSEIIVSEEKKFWKVLSQNTFLNYNNIELDKRLLTNYYKSLGYYDVQVLSSKAEVSNSNLSNLTYTINAGNRYKIIKISTNVSPVLDKKLFLPLQKYFSAAVGKYYSPFSVKKLLVELDALIASNNLQFIEHSVNEILEGDSIEIKINIFEGKKLLVEKINIKGNTITEESVIRSELLLDEGDPFNQLKLDQSLSRIKSRNIFGNVEHIVRDGANNSQKNIEITVEEKATGEISAGAGIGTAGGSFQFNITENNWLGKGISLSTQATISKETLQGNLAFTDPDYKSSGNQVSLFFDRTTNTKKTSGFKNDIFTSGIDTRFEQYKDIYLTPGIALSRDNLEVDSTASDGLKKQKGTFTDLTFSYGVLLDKRDKVYSPTDGYVSSFSQTLPVYADSPFIINSYSFSKYELLTPDAVGAFKFYATAINGLSDKDVRLNKRVKLPASKLRGFKPGKVGPKDGEDYVGGNYASAMNFEVNLPNLLPEATKTDVALFLDAGNLWGVDYSSAINDGNKLRSTAGIATSWLSPLGPMSFIFSRNISKANTDVIEKFNFNLGTTF
tara:strand:- start:3900 stop:6125 length:2226 start_codon:yes stop_codon:yes gene_type:complete